MERARIFQIQELSQFAFVWHGFGNRFFNRKQLVNRASNFKFALLNQIHSDIIIRLDGVPETPPAGDACITAKPGLMLVIQTADCLPILLLDPDRKVIGAAHCGWKGTAMGLASKMVKAMADEFLCEKENIFAAMGPCIGSSRYQVGEDVRRVFRQNRRDEAGFSISGNGLYLDLKQANRKQLQSAGVEKIFTIGNCTYSEPGCCSYRRDGAAAGRMLSFIGMRNLP